MKDQQQNKKRHKPYEWRNLRLNAYCQYPMLSIKGWDSFPFILEAPNGKAYKIEKTPKDGVQMTKF